MEAVHLRRPRSLGPPVEQSRYNFVSLVIMKSRDEPLRVKTQYLDFRFRSSTNVPSRFPFYHKLSRMSPIFESIALLISRNEQCDRFSKKKLENWGFQKT